jgi:hypothetical protein
MPTALVMASLDALDAGAGVAPDAVELELEPPQAVAARATPTATVASLMDVRCMLFSLLWTCRVRGTL